MSKPIARRPYPKRSPSATRLAVIKLVKQFKTQSEIAAALNISRQAVHQHINALRDENDPDVKPPTKRRDGNATRADVARLRQTHKPAEIAVALGLSVETIRTHLRVLRVLDETKRLDRMAKRRARTALSP